MSTSLEGRECAEISLGAIYIIAIPGLGRSGDTETHHGRDGHILTSIATPKPELWRSADLEIAKRRFEPERQNLPQINLTSASLISDWV